MTKLITIFDKVLNQRVFRLFEENEIEEKVDTNLTISASSTSIDVGNNVEVTGVLTDENNIPLGGMSIRILKNNVLVDTVTTNSNGVYSKLISGLDIGTYHFHASYPGNDVYDNALSETIDVSVVGHTYAVTITADKQSILTTESVTVTGTVTRDGTGYGGQTVRLFDDGTLIDTLTTDSNGNYTKTVSNLTQGTHRFYSQFDVYESSIILVEVVEHNYSIGISADNPIIQSGDTSIITATLLDGTDPVIDETLSYTLSNKGTVVGSGSASTNNDGEISITYVGAGLGDIDVEVTYGTLLQETYELEDVNFYDGSSSTNVSKYTVGTGASFSYDSTNTAYSIYPSSSGARFVTLDNATFDKNNKISIDFKLTSVPDNGQVGFVFGNVGVRLIYLYTGSVRRLTISDSNMNTDYSLQDYSISLNTWYTLELLPTGVLNLKQNNTVVATCNYDISSLLTDNNQFQLYVAHRNSTRAFVKNIKIKAL